MNKAILIGNLGNDPEVRYTQSGTAVANFRIATNEAWTDRNGQRQERTDWHRIVVWGKQAENCGQYLSKGRQVSIEGKIQTRQWEDNAGVKHYTTEVIAQRVEFLGSAKNQQTNRAENEQHEVPEAILPPPVNQQLTLGDEEVPF